MESFALTEASVPCPHPCPSFLASSCLCGRAVPPLSPASYLPDLCDCPQHPQAPDALRHL